MDKWTRSVVLSFDRLQQRVQSLLEENPTDGDPDRSMFEPSRDPLVIEALATGLPTDDLDRAVVAFNRLAGLFEAGILLENRGPKWSPLAVFRDGIAKPTRSEHRISLPHAGPLEVLRTPAKPLLKKLGLEGLSEVGDVSALLIRPTPEYAFVLLSSLPDLWLKDHSERVLDALARGFSS